MATLKFWHATIHNWRYFSVYISTTNKQSSKTFWLQQICTLFLVVTLYISTCKVKLDGTQNSTTTKSHGGYWVNSPQTCYFSKLLVKTQKKRPISIFCARSASRFICRIVPTKNVGDTFLRDANLTVNRFTFKMLSHLEKNCTKNKCGNKRRQTFHSR